MEFGRSREGPNELRLVGEKSGPSVRPSVRQAVASVRRTKRQPMHLRRERASEDAFRHFFGDRPANFRPGYGVPNFNCLPPSLRTLLLTAATLDAESLYLAHRVRSIHPAPASLSSPPRRCSFVRSFRSIPVPSCWHRIEVGPTGGRTDGRGTALSSRPSPARTRAIGCPSASVCGCTSARPPARQRFAD